jgi:dephospho-CoA kinase
LQNLEALIHPAVARSVRPSSKGTRNAPLGRARHPTAVRKGGAAQVDKVAVVSAPVSVQADRVLARPGMTCGKFAQILARQMPDEEKRRRADFIIDTGTPQEQTREQVRAIIACLVNPPDS